METFDVKLMKRAIGHKRKHTSIRPLYGDHAWAKDLDIVNELGGHTGCVNALSWSSSGRLLASGSDDTYLNIWRYNSDDQAKAFTLNTSVSTGHHANIFSVKFMPHSNDQTVITCAGDSEVRVFDLEYSGTAQTETTTSENARSRRFNDFFPGCKWLGEANTNARIYRSHADRAKRIVTESSPHLFLSCSEDGEIRQWDLRQPSFAYPPPRDRRRYGFGRGVFHEGGGGDVPLPLISYKQYGLDLNTISCSKSQPHYIALGGAHLHCFLHDRRMLGRNVFIERGMPPPLRPRPGTVPDEKMREATKCVRRFAPNNKRKMKPGDHGHITACKISDARPNELISSWSGDHVYSFDIIKGPDARDEDIKEDTLWQTARISNRAERKRKRSQKPASSASVGDGAQAGRRLRRVSDGRAEVGQTALRMRYENSETENVEIGEEDTGSNLLAAHESLLSEAQKQSERIARALVDLRKTMFDFSSMLQSVGDENSTLQNLTTHTDVYTKALGQAATLLPEMEQVMREWTYPNTEDEDEIMLQNTMRRNRQASWRFVQAAGCLSKVMGGTLQTASSEQDPRLHLFEKVRPSSREGTRIDDDARFNYDFIKAILLWLGGGNEAILDGFRRPPDLRDESDRFPFNESSTVEEVPTRLRDYLRPLIREDKPLVDLGTNQFERDDLRQLFENQQAAVQSFTLAIAQIQELRMQHGASDVVQESPGGITKRIMDKGAAARFWGEKVGRALLMTAAEGVTFNFVNRAFGGLKMHITPDDDIIDQILDEAEEQERMSIDTTESATAASTTEPTEGGTSATTASRTDILRVIVEEAEEAEERELGASVMSSDTDDDNNVPDDSEDEISDSDSDNEENDPLTNAYRRRRRRGLGGGPLSARRAAVNSNVAYTSHTKAYKGHCNTRTVKDVNYYGMDDEYVVSGSDDGHFFIWDRKTTKIVSVFEGDGEVVNVIQGHPYEPMIACSGIDSTIKIFGPGSDSRERYDARQGLSIANPGGGRHSTLGRRRPRTTSNEQAEDNEGDRQNIDESEDPEAVAPGGLKSRRVPMDKVNQITSQNNVERQRGIGDAYMTQGMLARLALALQNGELQGIEGQGFGAEGGTIVVDENCSVM